jgi:hypothetical protein
MQPCPIAQYEYYGSDAAIQMISLFRIAEQLSLKRLARVSFMMLTRRAAISPQHEPGTKPMTHMLLIGAASAAALTLGTSASSD